MIKKILLIVFLFNILVSSNVFAQSFGLDWLFQPSLRVGGMYMPTQKNADSVYWGMAQSQIGFVLPIGGKASLDLVNFDLKKIDIKARQTFLNFSAGLRFPNTNVIAKQQSIANLGVGLTYLKAGLRNGLWLYTFNAGVVQNVEDWNELNPFGLVAIAKVQIKGLRKQNIYGLGVGYFNERVLPIPIFGLNRKISKNWDFRMLLPMNIVFAHRFNKKVAMDLRLNTNIFQTQIFQSGLTDTWQYRQVQLSALMKFKIKKGFKINTELGFAGGRRLNVKNDMTESKFNLKPTPYLGLSLNISLGTQLLGSDLFSTEF